MPEKTYLSIGLMSGTSMDGIDAALIETTGEAQVKTLGYTSMDYHPSMRILLKAAEYTVRECRGDLTAARAGYLQSIDRYLRDRLQQSAVDKQSIALADYLCQPIRLDHVIQHSTALHAQLVQALLKKTGYQASDINVVGYHGQTLYHRPAEGISVIVGDGQALANTLGIKVVNNFRQADISAGGQGAPLAPLYHQALAVRDNRYPLAVVNCGGISNITLIPSADVNDLVAFDCGPGNVLLDQWVARCTAGAESMDKDGRYGLQGQVNHQVLSALYAGAMTPACQDYLTRPPPKSLDYGDMRLIDALMSLSIEDGCATLAEFTADSIVRSLSLVDAPIPTHWVLAGGGWKNPTITQALHRCLKRAVGEEVLINHADDIGWKSQAIEAETFAYLAVRSLQGKVISLPGTTGVPVALGGGVKNIPHAIPIHV